jgi:asparagine synthase (glutamine-hydrolysing)
MCGIAGAFRIDSDPKVVYSAVFEMTHALHHRGPDDGDVLAVSGAPVVVLGHRRLSILDLSSAGRQPMRAPEAGVSLVFNGEIYNFRALRAELESHGHVFRTATDTEVILRGYLQWGEQVVSRLRGIFAIAVWDANACALLLARDPLGVKPLYLHESAGGVVFASEVRALLAGGVERRLDLDGLRSYLAYGSVQEPFTMVREVRSLPAGHLGWVRNGRLTTRNYWTLPVQASSPSDVSTVDLDAIQDALTNAVGSQLISDVPIGAFLSGGIDSAAIALLMRRSGATDIRTFNICFREASFDEREYARLTAEAAGAQHTCIELGPEEFANQLPNALAAYDQPSVDGVNTWFISRAVREAGLTVALSGVGGDELFAGYGGFDKARKFESFARAAGVMPSVMRDILGMGLERFAWSEASRQAGSLLSSPMMPALPPYFAARRLLTVRSVARLLSPAMRDKNESWTELALRPLVDAVARTDEVNRISALELRSYMLSTLLRDTDQMSMAHALEVRVPLIDQQLVETILPIPGAAKLSDSIPKRLLVEPLETVLPADCIHRPKRGFTLPFDVWLREGAGRAMLEDRLTQIRGSTAVLDLDTVTALRNGFEQRRVGWGRVWSLFVLNDWLLRHGVQP